MLGEERRKFGRRTGRCCFRFFYVSVPGTAQNGYLLLRLRRPGHVGEVSTPGFVFLGPSSESFSWQAGGQQGALCSFPTVHKPVINVDAGEGEENRIRSSCTGGENLS